MREAGACRDAAADDAASQAAVAPSATVTMKLSDGTVVRVPREISSNINDGRKRAATNETAVGPKGAAGARASMQSGRNASSDRPLASQKLQVPDVIGRSYADAGNALAEFKVDRIETASAARAGEVLAQEPAPASLVLPGSTVSLQVSDGSLARPAGADTASAKSDATPSAPTAAAELAPPHHTDSPACDTRSISRRVLGEHCARSRRWGIARSDARRTVDASVAVASRLRWQTKRLLRRRRSTGMSR